MITRQQFRDKATTLTASVNGIPFALKAKEFKTGSLGHWGGGKITLMIGDQEVTAQVGINVTIVKSKELPA